MIIIKFYSWAKEKIKINGPILTIFKGVDFDFAVGEFLLAAFVGEGATEK